MSPSSSPHTKSRSPQPSPTQFPGSLPVEDNEPNWPRQWRAYVSLTGCFFLMFNSWGLVNAYGTFQSYYQERLMPNKDIFLFNLVGSTESFIVLINSFLIGRLLDAGYSRYILFVGWILVSLGMFTLSLSSGNGGYNEGNYALIWVTQGLTTGLGMACFFVSSSQIAATWFPKVKSMAICIVASGASIAGLVYPFMIRYLIVSLGWGNATRAVAGLTCGTAFLSWVCAVPNPDHPLNKGDETPWLSVRRWVDTSAFRNSTYNWFVASIAFMFFGFYAVFFNIEEWAAVKGLGKKGSTGVDVSNENGQDSAELRTFIYLAVMNAASTIGRLSSGYLSNKFGALKVHAVVMFLGSILLYAMWSTVSSVAGAMSFVVLFGAISGAIIGLPPATVANIMDMSSDCDHSKLGHWTGMMYTMSAPFALTGPVIAGHLISRYDSYLTVQMWSATCLFLSAVCLVISLWQSKHREALLREIRGSFSRRSLWREGDEKSVFWRSENTSSYASRNISEQQVV